MPDFKLLHAEVFPLTRELARTHQSMEPSPTERELKPLRMKFLRDRLEHGLFINLFWSKARRDGKDLRVNGQHSANLLAELPDDQFPSYVYVHYDTYEVGGDDGICELFRQFDATKSARSAVDIVGAYQGVYMPTDRMAPSLTKLLLEGYSWQRINQEGVTTWTGEDLGQSLHNKMTQDFVRFGASLNWDKFKEGKKAGVTAAMWATWSRNREAADKFWGDVIHDRHDDPNDPVHLLSEELIKIRNKIPPYSNGKVKPGKIYGLSLKSWKAHLEQRTLRKLEFTEGKELPEIAA